ncbi:MAG TPA: hypothetical protein VNA04_04565 [Thermoanaerobaculia bacterium]|nr:hypothetical protein [Thermoanaerobaculia bacterium]
MTSKRALAALFAAQIVAGAVLAQSQAPVPAASEFGRVSGGQIELLTSGTQKLSGSLGVSSSGGGRHGYDATLGGSLLEDRLWFFGAASMLPAMEQRAGVGAVDLKMDAQLGSRHALGATFSEGRTLPAATPDMAMAPMPSSFLSLRYTGVVSNNLFFDARFLRRSVTRSQHPFGGFGETR